MQPDPSCYLGSAGAEHSRLRSKLRVRNGILGNALVRA